MTDHAKMRQALMDGAIAAVAEYGLEGTTTRRIVSAGNINEGYIYRYYEDRDDLLMKTFLKLDKEYKSIFEMSLPTLSDISIPKRDRFKYFFDKFTKHLIEHRQETLFYIRYYESSFNANRAWEEHKKLYMDLREDVIALMKDPKYAFYVMHHLFRNMVFTGSSALRPVKSVDDEVLIPMFEILFTTYDAYFK